MRPVPNLTLRREDGRVVAESVTVADSTMRRLRGLLGKKDLLSGHGVLLRPAWSIHTAFMRFPIDVVPALRPWRTATRFRAKAVLELPAGEAERLALRTGERLEPQEVSS